MSEAFGLGRVELDLMIPTALSRWRLESVVFVTAKDGGHGLRESHYFGVGAGSGALELQIAPSPALARITAVTAHTLG